MAVVIDAARLQAAVHVEAPELEWIHYWDDITGSLYCTRSWYCENMGLKFY
jgi:hypothetical protein